MTARRKRSSVIAVAGARELAGWCWSLATVDDQPGPGPLTAAAPQNGRWENAGAPAGVQVVGIAGRRTNI